MLSPPGYYLDLLHGGPDESLAVIAGAPREIAVMRGHRYCRGSLGVWLLRVCVS